VTRWWLLGAIWLVAALVMSIGWQWQQRRSNAGIVDVLWSALLGVSAVACAVTGSGALRVLLGVAGGIWGARLALHLAVRMRSEREDGRYRHLRSLWGNSGLRWFAMFQFQALLVTLFSVPFVIAAANRRVVPELLAAAALVWCASVAGEALADRQLAAFRLDPANRGRTCRQGLWRYSRHPNYFFEWVHWFTYPLLAIGAPWAALAWSGPAFMLLFLRYLSGIPFTEAQALRTRGDDYRDYQRNTSILIPWPPRRG
jgi:steroid 5-alpha reductase family enzyme